MKFQKETIPFTMVANEVLASTSIWWGAKGVYGYMFSKPDGWDFSADRIAKEGIGERKMILRFLKELKEEGLLTSKKMPNGRMEYKLRFSQEVVPELTTPLFSQSTKSGLTAKVPERHRAETVLVSNTDSPSKKEVIHISAGAEINALIALFEPVNPAFERLFANRTQRAAIERLVKKFGYEKIEGSIRAAAMVCGQEYAPTITTPVQLESKLGSLAAFVKRAKAKAPGVVSL